MILTKKRMLLWRLYGVWNRSFTMRRPQFAAAVKARAINTATSLVGERMTINELNKIAESRLVGRGEERGRDRDWFVLNLYRCKVVLYVGPESE